jgi:hypothetical protein
MAEKLMRYYKFVEDRMGLEGKQRLARLTLIPSIIAATEPDSDENIARFRDAVKQLTGETPPQY